MTDTSTKLSAIQLAQIARQKKIADGTYVSTRMTPVEKAKANPRSKALAIRAMCFVCVGGEQAVSTIRNCTSGDSCPLYPHRPYQVDSNDADDEEEIIDSIELEVEAETPDGQETATPAA